MTNIRNHAVEQQLNGTKTDDAAHSGLTGRFQKFMCGWGVLVTAGVVSVTFLLCISLVPSTNIFPVYSDPYANMIPLIRQGNLRVYPPFLDRSAVALKNDTYYIVLPTSDLTSTIASLHNIIQSYPKEHTAYRQCWLQKPTYEYPCFFDAEWLGSGCTESNDFGYREVNGTFSPCVILRIENTGKWEPVPNIRSCQNFKTGRDPEFVKLDCQLKYSEDAKKLKSIQVLPHKGFSRMFFPMTDFDPKLYLFPVVAVQIKELMKGENITIICQIAAENAFYLDDTGLVSISFGPQPTKI